MRFHEILALLDGVKQNGRGHVALCPAHDDTNASLSANEGDDGRTLLHCHAGCAVEEIVAGIGLSVPDLYPATGEQRAVFDLAWPDGHRRAAGAYSIQKRH